MLEMMISLPCSARCAPKVCATRFMPSVVPRVKMISSSSAALMNWRTLERPPS